MQTGLRRGKSRIVTAMWGLIVVVLLAGLEGAIVRGAGRRPDYGNMQAAATYVWEHHHSAPDTKMFGYLPTTVFYLWPCMVWLPHIVGVCCYALLNLGYALLTMWLLYRWWWHPAGGPQPLARESFAWPVLIVAANLSHALGANQVTLLTLVLCVGGLTLIGRNREWSGGLVLGLGALVKVLPFLLVGLLVLRRKWRALGGVALAVLVFDILPSVLFFGIDGAVAEHVAWRERSAVYSSVRTIEHPLQWAHAHRSDFSYAAVLTRWLRRPPAGNLAVVVQGDAPPEVVAARTAALRENEYLVVDPRPAPDGETWITYTRDMGWAPRWGLADLSSRAVTLIWAGTLAAGALALVWLTWPRAGVAGAGESAREWFALASLWLVAMFYFTPLMRHYYLAWAFPAVVVVCDALVAEGLARRGRWGRGMVLGAVSLAGWVVGVACLGWEPVRWYGVHLAAAGLLAAATSWAYVRARRARLQVPASVDAVEQAA